MNSIATQNTQTDITPLPATTPLVVYKADLENTPLDRNARVTLTRLAYFTDELRRSGLPATLEVTDIKNEASDSRKKFETTKIHACMVIKDIGSIACDDLFGKCEENNHINYKDSVSQSTIFFAAGAIAGFLTCQIAGAPGMASCLWALVVGAGLWATVPAADISRLAEKMGSLKSAFQAVSDIRAQRPIFLEKKVDLLHKMTQKILNNAGDKKYLTLTPQEMTPSLKEMINYAQTQGGRIDVILPGAAPDNGLQIQSHAPTLGETVAKIARANPPALPKLDAEQEKWTGGLKTSFNRLFSAIESLPPDMKHSPDVKKAAQDLLDAVRTVQTLCAEVQIANNRIGKVTLELDNVSDQIDAYAQLTRLGIDTPENGQALTTIFAVKAASIAEHFAGDLEHVRSRFEDRQKLLENDYI